VPPRHVGQPGWRFDPLLNSTFYRITQGEQVRSAGDLDVAPLPQWVLRTARPASAAATAPELAAGHRGVAGQRQRPYLLAVGASAPRRRQQHRQVAPGFSEAELQKLEYAKRGQRGPAGRAARPGRGTGRCRAARRLMVLWGVLLGVAVLGFMVWRLIRSSRS
jgi:hypothetical protein